MKVPGRQRAQMAHQYRAPMYNSGPLPYNNPIGAGRQARRRDQPNNAMLMNTVNQLTRVSRILQGLQPATAAPHHIQQPDPRHQSWQDEYRSRDGHNNSAGGGGGGRMFPGALQQWDQVQNSCQDFQDMYRADHFRRNAQQQQQQHGYYGNQRGFPNNPHGSYNQDFMNYGNAPQFSYNRGEVFDNRHGRGNHGNQGPRYPQHHGNENWQGRDKDINYASDDITPKDYFDFSNQNNNNTKGGMPIQTNASFQQFQQQLNLDVVYTRPLKQLRQKMIPAIISQRAHQRPPFYKDRPARTQTSAQPTSTATRPEPDDDVSTVDSAKVKSAAGSRTQSPAGSRTQSRSSSRASSQAGSRTHSAASSRAQSPVTVSDQKAEDRKDSVDGKVEPLPAPNEKENEPDQHALEAAKFKSKLAKLSFNEIQRAASATAEVTNDKTYRINLQKTVAELADLVNGPVSQERYTQDELRRLYEKACFFTLQRSRNQATYRCRWMYRDKACAYYSNIQHNHGRLMQTYIKDHHGDPKSPINGRLEGLFFNIVVDPETHEPPVTSLFGERRLHVPVQSILNKFPNMYFTDFYCTSRCHYVTLVLTRPGTMSDRFCADRLVAVDPANNPFFCVVFSDEFQTTVGLMKCRPVVEIFVTEDIDIEEELKVGAYFDFVNMVGQRLGGIMGISKNKHCKCCNLNPVSVKKVDAKNDSKPKKGEGEVDSEKKS